MPFSEQINKGRTKAKAKKVLEDYTRYRSIIDNGLFDLGVKSPALDHQTFSNFVNFDKKLINEIEQKDRQYEEVKGFIQGVQRSINRLKENQIEIINMKYVNGLSNQEIIERLNSTGQIISERHFSRVLQDLYIDFAIAHGIYVMKDQ